MKQKIKSESKTLKIAILSSFTIDLLPKYLETELKKIDIAGNFYLCGFNQYQQDILNTNSEFYKFNPVITILFFDSQDLFKQLIEEPFSLTENQKESIFESEFNNIKSLIETIQRNLSQTTIFLNNLVLPPLNDIGLLEYNSAYSIKNHIHKFNQKISSLAISNHNLFIVDYESFITRYGYENLIDERIWYLAKMRFHSEALTKLAQMYILYIKPLIGLTKKCIVLDLDNTLWGGIIGEDGFNGINLSNDGIGKAFHDFQKTLQNLSKRGIILAINSKNNYDDAIEVIEKHPYMILRKNDFASIHINWSDKASNMIDIAQELNIGLNSIVFIDDNPVERDYIRNRLPEVTVIDLPKDFALYKKTLLSSDLFNILTITEEDKSRVELYKAQVKREHLKKSVKTINEFYRSLEMTTIIEEANSFTIPRIAQLTQRTNQFNLTTRRYTQSDIQNFTQDNNHLIYSLELIDKFGNNGIVGVIIIKRNYKDWIIDTFLLSCRTIGRKVETAFLSFISKKAKSENINTLKGEYLPTKKNILVKDFYQEHNFVNKPENSSWWEFDITQNEIKCPEFIKITTKEASNGK